MTHKRIRAARLVWLIVAQIAFSVSAEPVAAQGYSRPIDPCPTNLTLRFLGLTTFRHAGYAWDTQWTLRMQIKPGQGYYVPPGQPYRIYSTDGEAVWKNPGLIVACMEYVVDLYVMEVHLEIWVEQFLGTVEKVCEGGGGSGGGGGDAETDLISVASYSYDPYDPALTMDEGQSGDCGTAPGGNDGGGTQYEPGDNTGGETVEWDSGVGTGDPSACGDHARVDYVCIDVWVDGVGWVEWGCGYVTTC